MYFISYSSKDAKAAQKVVAFLEERGIACWIAPRNIIPGFPFPSQIVKAIRECSGFVLVASNNINQSNHINSEVARAFDLNKRIFPFLIDPVELSDDYIYYLGQIQWINAYDDFDKGLEDLQSVIAHNNLPDNSSSIPTITKFDKTESFVSESKNTKQDVRIATYQELTELGLTALDIAKRLVENDYKLYPEMVVENEGSPEQWATFLSTYPETFRYLVNDKNEIIGNWSFLAISEALHAQKLKSGELKESTFRLDEAEYLLFPGEYVGYLLNFSVNTEYKSPKNVNKLLQAFVEQLLSYAEDEIFFKAWYVNVFRKDHEAMYRRMGFSYLLDNVSFGKVYHLNCIPATREPQRKTHSDNAIFLASKRLMEFYYDHFVQET